MEYWCVAIRNASKDSNNLNTHISSLQRSYIREYSLFHFCSAPALNRPHVSKPFLLTRKAMKNIQSRAHRRDGTADGGETLRAYAVWLSIVPCIQPVTCRGHASGDVHTHTCDRHRNETFAQMVCLNIREGE